MKRILKLLLLIFACISFIDAAQQSKGHLLIIGGGDRPDYIMNKIIELAGGKEAKIVIIPMASSEPVETALYQQNQFRELGVLNTSYLYCTAEEANADSNLKKLEGATGIFFSGGDQSRLTKALLGSKILERIGQIYHSGGVLSGTSAGAAVMSKVMITGNEKLYPDTEQAFRTIQADNIENVEGFGFVTEAIIDQHFVARKRHNRLISLVLEKPELLGIAIDEATSIVVYPERIFEVLGESQVIIYDATQGVNISQNSNKLLSGKNIKMHILINGDKFNLLTKKNIEVF